MAGRLEARRLGESRSRPSQTLVQGGRAPQCQRLSTKSPLLAGLHTRSMDFVQARLRTPLSPRTSRGRGFRAIRSHPRSGALAAAGLRAGSQEPGRTSCPRRPTPLGRGPRRGRDASRQPGRARCGATIALGTFRTLLDYGLSGSARAPSAPRSGGSDEVVRACGAAGTGGIPLGACSARPRRRRPGARGGQSSRKAGASLLPCSTLVRRTSSRAGRDRVRSAARSRPLHRPPREGCGK